MLKMLGKILAAVLLAFVIGALVLLGVIFLLVAATDDSARKKDVFAYVTENREALEEAIDQGEIAAYANRGFIKDIDVEENVVDFSCGGAGIGSGTSYVGFFYSAEDDLAAAWCAPYSAEMLTPSGSGFEWHEGEGDNRYYVEHICGHFYYYEAAF